MKTTKTEVSQTLQIWAVPQSDWHREQYPDDPPFRYEVRTDKPWGTGCVMVHEQDVTVVIPEGIDITRAAIKTLQEAINETMAEAQVKVDELTQQIDKLLMLEHKPDLEVV